VTGTSKSRTSSAMALAASALLAMPVLAATGTPVAADPTIVSREIQHNSVETIHFDDDICGPRANWTTFTRTLEKQRFVLRGDGTWNFQYTGVVTYISDYDDPSLPEVSGRLTEVGNYNLTPSMNYVATETFHDFFGDVRIWWKLNLKVVDGQPVVDRTMLEVTGCP
jgi:hypothetical protein